MFLRMFQRANLNLARGQTVQAIHTLRSGKKVDNQVQLPPNSPNVENPSKEKEKEMPKESTKKDDQVVVDTQGNSFVPKTLFPQRP